ncbi:MAG: hypothetical protein DHS20C21_00940 [Gemmatimonadota bacterium]|nr:MAG: hypothetical protein DHS20C21_00940 [Gemmatimonadota bacterium]
MQLSATKPGSVRRRLAAAACVLVGATATPVDAIEVSSANLVYSESNRVTVLETRGSLRADFGDRNTLTILTTFDSLTGASPNGAVPSPLPQVFTRASGGGSYTMPPGETPVDDSFEDTRIAGSASLARSLGRMTTMNLGASYSTEFDYESVGIDARIAHDVFQRNTTLSLGLSRSFDTVDPVGGPPVPLATMRRGGLPQPKAEGPEHKAVTDAVIGVTQVVDAVTLVQMNYAFHHSSGYLTDPYKLVSVVQAEDAVSPGTPFEYVYEKRPGSRTKHALYGRAKRALDLDVLDVSYRYLWDDWGVRSHTIEGRYHWEATSAHGLEPQLRYYRQVAADFFAYHLVDGAEKPVNVSADARLADLHSWTAALQYRYRFTGGSRLAARLGYYRQDGDGPTDTPFGAMKDRDLFPTLNAIISQISFTIGW